MDFIHPLLNEEFLAIGGHYVITKEDKLPFQDKEVLYLVGYGILDNSCCGPGGCGYAIVPGYIVDWHTGTTEDQARFISSVEPVEEGYYKEIGRLLHTKESVTQVHFHTASGERRILNFF